MYHIQAVNEWLWLILKSGNYFMSVQPFYFVTLTHATWEDALTYAKGLPPEAMAELRLDLFQNKDPEEMVKALHGKCIVSCRRIEDGGNWQGNESDRVRHLLSSMKGKPTWVDLEWDLNIPQNFDQCVTHTRLLRSVHVRDGIFDLEERLNCLPNGDLFKWVGKALSLVDNIKIKKALSKARSFGLKISAFLTGPKGVISRCMQSAWGGSFTYAHPDNALPTAPGQISFGNMMSWQCHKLQPNCQLCGVIGHPILHSLGPNYHNKRFQQSSKNILYLPLECCDPKEAHEAIESLELLGVSITAPLKVSLPFKLGLEGPINTIWRQKYKTLWRGTNTDYSALNTVLNSLTTGPVLILGDGGVAKITEQAILDRGWPCLLQSRRNQISLDFVNNFKPVGIIQATCLGMQCDDPLPFSETLTTAQPSVKWGIEWVYKEDTAFAKWIRKNGNHLVSGVTLFELQASRQSDIFVGSIIES
jgi:3-dehydroquinate dehydratase type I